MKKYVKPAIHCENLDLGPVLTLSCEDNAANYPIVHVTTSNGYDGDAYDVDGNKVFTTNPCASLDVGVTLPTWTNGVIDYCADHYACYHNPDADWNTLFGS